MKLARYWVCERGSYTGPQGELRQVSCWGWSQTSADEARQLAQQNLQQTLQRLPARLVGPPATSLAEQRGWRYGYGDDRPLREEILEEMADDRGELLAAVTRNAYGCLVLNTRDLMFVDIDLPQTPPVRRLWQAMQRLLGRRTTDAETALLQRLEAAWQASPYGRVRIYHTHSGYRCAVLDRPLPPQSEASRALLDTLQADPLYVRLCRSQQSYRARLTPKFWRCGARRPPSRFPWASPEQEHRYRQWEQHYTQAIRGWATCRLVKELGEAPIHDDFRRLIELHDSLTRCGEPLPLA
jgi:hypothetical protein